MDMISLIGRITKSGKLEVRLPKGIAPGEVRVTIEPIPAAEDDDWEDRPWTDEEIKEMLRPDPKTGAEIAASDAVGMWADRGITDSVEWLKEQRRQRRVKRGW
jgi:hypothetical protein